VVVWARLFGILYAFLMIGAKQARARRLIKKVAKAKSVLPASVLTSYLRKFVMQQKYHDMSNFNRMSPTTVLHKQL
jgi:hypothetical protein